MIRDIAISLSNGIRLRGFLDIPGAARGIVAFVHGSGSSRFSPRNHSVARRLFENGFGTLLMDLLTQDEEAIDAATQQLRFDVDMLAGRVVEVIDWLQRGASTRHLPIGLFGASTGAAGALIAAARRPSAVCAMVSRGGRPDLAMRVLRNVQAPTLLIVGALDSQVLTLNREALKQITAEKKLIVVADATHLFEEPGALSRVADHAVDWFTRFLRLDPIQEKVAS